MESDRRGHHAGGRRQQRADQRSPPALRPRPGGAKRLSPGVSSRPARQPAGSLQYEPHACAGRNGRQGVALRACRIMRMRLHAPAAAPRAIRPASVASDGHGQSAGSPGPPAATGERRQQEADEPAQHLRCRATGRERRNSMVECSAQTASVLSLHVAPWLASASLSDGFSQFFLGRPFDLLDRGIAESGLHAGSPRSLHESRTRPCSQQQRAAGEGASSSVTRARPATGRRR